MGAALGNVALGSLGLLVGLALGNILPATELGAIVGTIVGASRGSWVGANVGYGDDKRE